MYTLLKIIRGFVRIVTSESAPWQVFLGTFLGVCIGMLPWFRYASGPSPLVILLILAAVFVNCHLGSALLFTGVGTLLALALEPLAISLGHGQAELAQSLALNPLTYALLLSDTRVLGLTILMLPIAPIAGILMTWAARAFDRHLRAKIAERKRLLKAGKVAGNSIIMRLACWFFGI